MPWRTVRMTSDEHAGIFGASALPESTDGDLDAAEDLVGFMLDVGPAG